jgi:prephenate dehydrogenase (NADP+)
MGTAWSSALSYPWEEGYYVGGIETVKVNIMLRIYSSQWHVCAGLAILNPSARVQIDQYAQSATELFKLMLAADEKELTDRIYDARDKVFGNGNRKPILLREDLLDRFNLGKKRPLVSSAANSHLSLLAMVDCWAHLNIQPFEHLLFAATPVFRMWIGVAEYLFRSSTRLDSAIRTALYDTLHRSDDLEFVIAARGWSQSVSFGNFDLYKRRFQKTKEFFESRFEAANKVGGKMIQAVTEGATTEEEWEKRKYKL